MPIYRIPDLKERLRALRGEKTQQEIADVIGVAQSTYALYEKGDREPSLDAICKLANYYSTTTDYLLGASDCKNLDNDIIYKVTGLSEYAIERIKQFYDLGLNNLVSSLIFSGGFMNALWQMSEMLKLNLKDKHHVIITRDELDKLNNGEKVDGHVVPAGTIRNIYATKAKEDMGKAIDETLKEAEGINSKAKEAEQNGDNSEAGK